jgi:DNA-binding CsgD family transcriptional regulator/tetratricopeptide (TPR) repeat protein
MTAVVGRDRELAEIRAFLELVDGAPRVLLIRGDAGIGKTTLWRAALEEASRLGYRVLASAASGSETQLPFTTVRDLLAPAFDDIAAELPEPQRRALAVALLQEEPAGSPTEPATTAVAFLGTLRALAREGRVLVAVDDVQWVDRASAAILAYGVRRLEREPIAVVFARRLDVAGTTALDHDRPDDFRTRILDVHGLSVGALGKVLHDQLEIAYPRPTLHRLHDVSGGNPFFALELARASEQAPEALRPGAPVPVPTSLRALVRTRLEALPAETLAALTFLALMARPALGLLGAALGGDPTPVLLPAEEAHVIDFWGTEVRFAHPLLAAGVLDLASPERLRNFHRRLAAILDDSEERVRHLALGADGPDAAIASALEESARATDARGHRIVSAELYEAAARLTPETDAEGRARRALSVAAALFDAGDANRAAASIEALLAQTKVGAERVDAELLLGKIVADVGRWDDAMRVWAGALEATDDPASVADVRSSMAVLSIYAGSTTEAIVHAAKAVAAARKSGSDTRLAYAYAARAMASVAVGDASYLALLRDALALEPVDEAPSSAWDWSPANAASACALHAFDLDEIRLRFGALLADGVETGNADLEQYGAYGLAQAELAAGNPGRARELSDVVEQLATETGVLSLPGGRLRAEVDAHFGRAAEARTRLEAVISESDAVGARRYAWHARAALGGVELADGRPEVAAEELRAARKLAEEIGMQDPAIVASFVDETEAAAEADLLDQAEEALAAAQGVRSLPRWGPPLLLRATASVAARRGRLEDAESSLTRAAGAVSELPVQEGRILLALGSVQRRRRRRAAARETLRAALATFERHGAELWAKRTREEIARIGGRIPAGDELTPNEQRIAQLVAEGKTNKEVAAILVVADRTVESALTQIYRKLDVRSRTELARKLTPTG